VKKKQVKFQMLKKEGLSHLAKGDPAMQVMLMQELLGHSEWLNPVAVERVIAKRDEEELAKAKNKLIKLSLDRSPKSKFGELDSKKTPKSTG
jgi:hypothetical protein